MPARQVCHNPSAAACSMLQLEGTSVPVLPLTPRPDVVTSALNFGISASVVACCKMTGCRAFMARWTSWCSSCISKQISIFQTRSPYAFACQATVTVSRLRPRHCCGAVLPRVALCRNPERRLPNRGARGGPPERAQTEASFRCPGRGRGGSRNPVMSLR